MKTNFNAIEKKQFRIFFIIAYLGVILWTIPIYMAKQQGIAMDIFPVTNMNLPALGVILAILMTRKEDSNIPKLPFYGFILYTVIYLVLTLLYLYNPEGPYLQITPFVLIVFSLLFYIEYLVKSRRPHMEAYGMAPKNMGIVLLLALYFIVTFFIRTLGPAIVSGQTSQFSHLASPNTAVLAGLILIDILLSFLPFFGEEYGWRYFMQPLFQKKYGMVPGVLLTGLFWGLWHLPLNLFYYSANGMALMSIINQAIFCILIGIFLAYAYNRTRTIWAPVLLHFLNNNLLLFLVNPETPDTPLLQNQTYTWQSILYVTIICAIIYGLFIFTKYVKDPQYRMPTMNEMADAALFKSEVYEEVEERAEERRIQQIEREVDPYEESES